MEPKSVYPEAYIKKRKSSAHTAMSDRSRNRRGPTPSRGTGQAGQDCRFREDEFLSVEYGLAVSRSLVLSSDEGNKEPVAGLRRDTRRGRDLAARRQAPTRVKGDENFCRTKSKLRIQ